MILMLSRRLLTRQNLQREYIENNSVWHGKAPNDEEYATAMADLEKVGEALCQK